MVNNIIVILNSISEFERFKSLNQLDYKNILFIPIDLKLRIVLKKAFITYKAPEDFLTKEELLLIDDTAYKIAENWHNNTFMFKYISLAKVMEYEFRSYLSRIIKNINVIKNVIKKEKPLKIISFNNNNFYIREFNEILNYICKKQNIKLQIFSGRGINSKYELLKYTPKLKLQKYYKFVRSIFVITFLYLIFYFKLLIPINKNKRRILFVHHNLYNFHPSVIKKLSKNRRFNLFFFDLIIEFEIFRKYLVNQFRVKKINTDTLFFEIFRNLIIKKKAIKFIKNNFKTWLKDIKHNKINKKFDYNNFNLWPFVKKKIITVITIDFKRIIENCLIIEYLLKHKKINLLILNNSDREFDYLNVLVSHNLNISSLVIDHGLLSLDTTLLTPFPNPFTKYAAWNSNHKDAFITGGINPERIVKIGSPRFDKYLQINNNYNLKKKIKKLVFQDFHIDRKKKLIVLSPPVGNFLERVYSFGTYPSEIENIIRCILKTIKNSPNIYLVIKIHPQDQNLDAYNELIEDFGINNASVIKNYNLVNILCSCDCLITKYSTIGLEAMILEKPVICLNFNKEKIHYIVSDAAFKLSNCNELSSLIKKILENPLLKRKERKQFAEIFNYKNDGLATQRAYRMIKNLLNNN